MTGKETTMDADEIRVTTEDLPILMDNLLGQHGIHVVLSALEQACEFQNDLAHDTFDLPLSEEFDPAWARVAGMVRRMARTGTVNKIHKGWLEAQGAREEVRPT